MDIWKGMSVVYIGLEGNTDRNMEMFHPLILFQFHSRSEVWISDRNFNIVYINTAGIFQM